MDMDKQLKLIYIVGTFPAFSTVFIDREIRSMRQQNVDLQIVAIRKPTEDQPLSSEQRDFMKDVTYLLPLDLIAFLLGNLLYLISQPLTYLGTFFYLISRPHPNLRTRLMTILHFAEGVHAAYLLRGQTFNHLHAHFVDRAAIVALVASRLCKVPYSLTAHANDIYVNPVLLREKIQGAKFMTTCTGYNFNYLTQEMAQDLNGKLHLAYHGLDLSNYQPASERTPRTRPLLMSVGRLTEKKGFTYLIDACRALVDQGYDFECHIVGPGPLYDTLTAQIESQNLTDVITLCGPIPHDDVISKYNEATAFVLPCIVAKDGDRDGIPNVLIEAMAMQLPAVSTNHSGIPELIEDGVSGLLVPPTDVLALTQALKTLLDDPQLCARLAKRGRQKVLEDFELQGNTSRLRALFEH